MKITVPCVVALTWVLRDGQGEVLDELPDPVEFLVGGDDLLPALEEALQDCRAGDHLHLHLDPERAFGAYDKDLVFLLPRATLPDGVEPGLLIEASALPQGSVPGVPDAHLLTISDVYPDHVVLDGNHPLAGMALQLDLTVGPVRAATTGETSRRSAGAGFFRLQTAPDADQR